MGIYFTDFLFFIYLVNGTYGHFFPAYGMENIYHTFIFSFYLPTSQFLLE